MYATCIMSSCIEWLLYYLVILSLLYSSCIIIIYLYVHVYSIYIGASSCSNKDFLLALAITMHLQAAYLFHNMMHWNSQERTQDWERGVRVAIGGAIRMLGYTYMYDVRYAHAWAIRGGVRSYGAPLLGTPLAQLRSCSRPLNDGHTWDKSLAQL